MPDARALIRPLLIGLASGQRALTPLAVVSLAARAHSDKAVPDSLPARVLAKPWIAAGTTALAAAELAGDKMKSAPDRTVPAGLIARTLTSALAGAALAPRGRRAAAGLVSAAGAVGASFLGLALRKRAMARVGQTRSGLVEDGLVLAAALAIVAAPALLARGR